MNRGSHSAAPNAIGYQYQTWWALVELLRSGNDRPDAAISLELYDDIGWEQAGSPTELLQTKHHENSQRTLTDRATDVWKTLQVWMDEGSPGDTDGPALTLVTTQEASAGSAMAALRIESRDEASALKLLNEVAADEGAEVTRKTRKQFLALSPATQKTFIHRICVVDRSPHIEDVDSAARACLNWALPRGHESVFMSILWQWWDTQALALLQGRLDKVDVGAAKEMISYIRDQFTAETLPTMVGLSEVNETELARRHGDSVFVQQMNWIAFPPRNLQKAIVDYYRAYTQAVRWLDEDLIALAELERFEAELVDEWEREFEFMQYGLDDDADEATKQAAGTNLLRSLLAQTAITVRPKYNDSFFARGRRHVLADGGRVGWHTDFQERVEQLLQVST
jgi:hypothetical protein